MFATSQFSLLQLFESISEPVIAEVIHSTDLKIGQFGPLFCLFSSFPRYTIQIL